MTLFETLSDAMTLAATVLSGAAGEPDEAQVALAWLARNRRDQALGAKGWQFGDGSLAEACRSIARENGKRTGGLQIGAPGESGVACYRALAIACQVLSGQCGDPTGGAVLLHRHDEQPAWAAGRQPVALLGSHFFYRLD